MMRLVLLAVIPLNLSAQSPSDIWVADFTITSGVPTLSNVVRVTDHPGYDNQPRFTPDGSALLYTSYRDGQADIWRYDFAMGVNTPVTQTPESEYSPTPVPGRSGRIAVVRVEADSTQRLWTFGPDGTDPRVLLPTLRGVGYFAWFPDSAVVTFIVGNPLRLELVPMNGDSIQLIAEGIGPSFAVIASDPSVLYSSRAGETWQLRAWDPAAPDRQLLIATLPDGPSFAYDPLRDVVLAPGNGTIDVLSMRHLGNGFQAAQGLDDLGLTGITRIAMSGDGHRVAFVAAEPD